MPTLARDLARHDKELERASRNQALLDSLEDSLESALTAVRNQDITLLETLTAVKLHCKDALAEIGRVSHD